MGMTVMVMSHVEKIFLLWNEILETWGFKQSYM